MFSLADSNFYYLSFFMNTDPGCLLCTVLLRLKEYYDWLKYLINTWAILVLCSGYATVTCCQCDCQIWKFVGTYKLLSHLLRQTITFLGICVFTYQTFQVISILWGVCSIVSRVTGIVTTEGKKIKCKYVYI